MTSFFGDPFQKGKVEVANAERTRHFRKYLVERASRKPNVRLPLTRSRPRENERRKTTAHLFAHPTLDGGSCEPTYVRPSSLRFSSGHSFFIYCCVVQHIWIARNVHVVPVVPDTTWQCIVRRAYCITYNVVCLLSWFCDQQR